MDKADADHDRLISEHIMKTHSLATSSSSATSSSVTSSSSFYNTSNPNNIDENSTLSQKLRLKSKKFNNHHITTESFRKYIEYAKEYIHPKLSPSAAKILQRLYLTMRSQSTLGNSIPVTTRHLESLIRWLSIYLSI
jgi:DNA helicase MCM8